MAENNFQADFSNKIQNKIVFDLYCYTNNKNDEDREMIFQTYPNDLITKTLNEYRIFFDIEAKKFKILAETDRQTTQMTLVHYFTAINDCKMLDCLVQFRPDLEIPTNFYCLTENVLISNVTAFWIAAYNNYKPIVETLLKNGSNPNAVNDNLSTALRLFAFDNNLSGIQLLVKYNADVNKGNNLDNTPLMLAASKGYYEIVAYLLENGTDPNLAAKCGNTALHFATKFRHLNIVKLLIKFGAKFQTNSSGLTPLFLAAFNGFTELVDYFFSIPNLVTLQDQIITYELLSCSHFTQEDDDVINNPTLLIDNNQIFQSLLKAFELRNVEMDLNSSNLNNLQHRESNYPYHRKCILPERPEFRNIKETETKDELLSIKRNSERIILESFFALERFFGEFSLNTAKALLALSEHQLQLHLKYLTFKKAIEIKIRLKLFVGAEVLNFMHHFRNYSEDIWLDIVQFSIKYFGSLTLPYYRELPFQLNLDDFGDFDHFFTLNDVKVDNIIDKNRNKTDIKEDIQKMLQSLNGTIILISRVCS